MQQVTESEELKLSVKNINDVLQCLIEQYTLKIKTALFNL